MSAPFVEAADLVFDARLEPASSDVSAASHLLESLGGLASGVRRAADREALARHALALRLRAREKAAGEHLKRRIDAACDWARPALLATGGERRLRSAPPRY